MAPRRRCYRRSRKKLGGSVRIELAQRLHFERHRPTGKRTFGGPLFDGYPFDKLVAKKPTECIVK